VSESNLDLLSINTIRTLSMDAVQAANSGHPGTPMALAPVAYTLWQKYLRYDPNDPIWANRDRFVLSNGHASMLLYSLIHLAQVRAVDPNDKVLDSMALTIDDLNPVAVVRVHRFETAACQFGENCGLTHTRHTRD